MKEPLDQAMSNYARVCASALGKDCSLAEGAGAAGGLGFAFLSLLNARLIPGPA